MLFEQLGITKKDDITHDLKSNQMKKRTPKTWPKLSHLLTQL